MKLLNKLLTGLGSLFVLPVALFMFLFSESKDLLEQNRVLVETFANDLTKNLSIANFHKRFADKFVVQLDSSGGKRTNEKLSAVGATKNIYDTEVGAYNASTERTTRVISFKADFENAKCAVSVTQIKKDDKALVQGFHLSAPDRVQTVARKHKA